MIATSKYCWQTIFALTLVNSPKKSQVANKQKNMSKMHEKSRAQEVKIEHRVARYGYVRYEYVNSRVRKKRGLEKRKPRGHKGHKT